MFKHSTFCFGCKIISKTASNTLFMSHQLSVISELEQRSLLGCWLSQLSSWVVSNRTNIQPNAEQGQQLIFEPQKLAELKLVVVRRHRGEQLNSNWKWTSRREMFFKFQSQTPEEPLRSLRKAGALNSGGVQKKKKTEKQNTNVAC